MPSPAEIPQQDEALKSLVSRFKEAPGSDAFISLASALLSRGHAAEALRITEHGLQLNPRSVEGRVERSAALLAMGRPRVAYVELLRALAIHPSHTRGMRLLGRAFKDAGVPERAAALLAQRSRNGGLAHHEPPTMELEPHPPEPSEHPEWEQRPDIDLLQSDPDRTAEEALPALFSALTKDLGLAHSAPQNLRTPPRRVEVTQIIRRRGMPRPPRSPSELAGIDGPIVDTTQPGQIDLELDEPADVETTREPAPMIASGSPDFGLALGDEPLFQEHMPFAVRPVQAEGTDEPGDATDVEHIEENKLPIEQALSPTPPPLDRSPTLPAPEKRPPELPPAPPKASSTGPKASSIATTSPMNPASPPPLVPKPSDSARDLRTENGFEPTPVVEKSRSRGQPKLQVTDGQTSTTRWILALVAMTLMVVYLTGLWMAGEDRLQFWLEPPPPDNSSME